MYLKWKKKVFRGVKVAMCIFRLHLIPADHLITPDRQCFAWLAKYIFNERFSLTLKKATTALKVILIFVFFSQREGFSFSFFLELRRRHLLSSVTTTIKDEFSLLTWRSIVVFSHFLFLSRLPHSRTFTPNLNQF